ncbi:MAG: hypothetical protein OEX07_04415 [Gammaproteobacteria bacterium]|nr:hypothetical protein [Gammaproteobacteria bacterium]
MRVTIRTWPEKIEIANTRSYFNPTDHKIEQFRRADDAMRWLRPHLSNHLLMKNLRSLLASEQISNPEKMSNPQVAQYVATMLFQNKLVLAKTFLLKREPAIIVKEQAAPPPAAAAEVAAPRAEPSEIAPVEEAVDNTDHEAQAATLVAAAEDGTPFCEECEKKKKARQQKNAA